jgi:hypothetical protein
VGRGAQGAGLASGLLPYDLRRAAIRTLIRSGVSTTVAMKISGHLTDSTFRRYDITSVEDIADAVEKVAAYVDHSRRRGTCCRWQPEGLSHS